jgi:hypothetical protein
MAERTSRHVRYPVAIGDKQTLRGRAKIDVIDPQRHLIRIACCSSEARSGPYQSSRLDRYDAPS